MSLPAPDRPVVPVADTPQTPSDQWGGQPIASAGSAPRAGMTGTRKFLLVGGLLVAAVVVLVVGAMLASFASRMTAEQSGEMGPNLVGLGFGTGGTDCELTGQTSTFREGQTIHVAMTMSPALPVGGTVTARLEKDGTELVGEKTTPPADGPSPCFWQILGNLDVGHYLLTIQTDPSMMPPTTGEFDITP